MIKRRHFLCRDHTVKMCLIKGLIKSIKAASVLLHGEPDDEFHLELEEFIFRGHFLTCYVGKYSIIVLKL